jgi:broad specificity phosphatase PhoE
MLNHSNGPKMQADWVKLYNTNELDRSVKPTVETIAIAKTAGVIMCSDLPRSIESAQVLGVQAPTIIDPNFQEAGLPIGDWNYPKLSVRLWAIIFRVFWLFGYSNRSESLNQTKKRASLAAQKLVQLAEQHDVVLFVGHGIINRLIAKEIRNLGWDGPKVPNQENWGFGIYKKVI